MSELKIANTETSGLAQGISVQTTQSVDTDADASAFWITKTWPKHFGYYIDHNSVKTIINKVGMWSVGKGWKADEETTKILEKIVGTGKDTFDEVMNNQVRVRHIDGNSYAEIITSDGELINETGSNLLNLKPLNPGKVKKFRNNSGMLSHYEIQQANGKWERFEKEEIFELALNKTADESHGRGDIEALITYLDKIKQVDEDMAVMFHRFVVPLIIWKVKTDTPTDLKDFRDKQKDALDKSKSMVVPDGTVANWELLEAGKNGVDPLEWRKTWVEEVTKGGGVPALIMAIEAQTTEASSKMVYLAWQQVIEAEQNYEEKQIKLQLHLDVKFEFPARIEENLGEDEGKDSDINKTKRSEVEITSIKKGNETKTSKAKV